MDRDDIRPPKSGLWPSSGLVRVSESPLRRLLASALDATLLMDAQHRNTDQHSVGDILGMAKPDEFWDRCGPACGAGRVASAGAMCGKKRPRLDAGGVFANSRGTCGGLSGTSTSVQRLPFLDFSAVAAMRARLKREFPNGAEIESNAKGAQLGCNICTHAHPAVAEFLRARRFAVRPRPASAPRTLCGGRPVPPGALTVGLHVRRGDCPQWRFVPWGVYHGVLDELASAVSALPAGSAARKRFSGKIFACVITESPPTVLRELKTRGLPQTVEVHVKPAPRAAPQAPPKRHPGHRALPATAAQDRRRLHTNARQLGDFYELSDDYDVIVDSLSSFYYFAALFSKGLKIMLSWHFARAAGAGTARGRAGRRGPGSLRTESRRTGMRTSRARCRRAGPSRFGKGRSGSTRRPSRRSWTPRPLPPRSSATPRPTARSAPGLATHSTRQQWRRSPTPRRRARRGSSTRRPAARP